MKGLILLSGGLDSATVLGIARSENESVCAVSYDYNQRHRVELKKAEIIAKNFGIEHKIIKIDFNQFGGSALTDINIDIPKNQPINDEIPITYVPARNTIFLSLALAWAELTKSNRIYVGVNAVDYSGYPDCRPEFIDSFQRMANLATKNAIEGTPMEIKAPLIDMTKAEIITKGISLGIDYSETLSCYDPSPDGKHCGECAACHIRLAGFKMANYEDPAKYIIRRAS